MTRTEQLLAFIKEIEKFKVLERKTYTSNLERKESDAEHSWHLAMFVWLFSSDFPIGVDLLKVIKLALIHDLVELYSGDPLPFDKQECLGKEEREDVASVKLFSQLPEDLKREFSDLYLEYRNLSSEEAKIVKAYDKAQPIWQNVCSTGKFWQERNISLADVEKISGPYMRAEDNSQAVYENIIAEAKRLKLL